MNKLSKISLQLRKMAYEHDPDILKKHELEVKEKIKQLDVENNYTDELLDKYIEELKRVKYNSNVTPQDVSSLLHVFDKE